MNHQPDANGEATLQSNAHLHLCFGWWQLFVFLSLGIGLEVMHGFKIGWYLNADNETRRLMLTLAHTHGTLLGIINIVFSWTLIRTPHWTASKRYAASRCLLGASVLMPLGYFAGGLFPYPGDPSLAILLLPAGAFPRLVSALLTALATTQHKQGESLK